MTSNAELLKRLSNLSNGRKRQLSKPAQKLWNDFAASPLFDEIHLLLQSQLENRPTNCPEVHLFAQEAGFQEGYRQCLQDLSLGFPEAKEDPTQPEQVYSAFSAPKKK